MQPAEMALEPGRDIDDFEPQEFSGPLEWYWHFSQRNDFQVDMRRDVAKATDWATLTP